MLRGIALIAAVAFALAVAGCSDDDSGDETQTDAETTEQEGAQQEPIPVADAQSVDLDERLIEQIEMPTADWLVFAFDSLWVKRDDGDVTRVDPANGKVTAEISNDLPDKQHICQGIGASDDAIWSCPREGSLERIDPGKNAVAETVEIDKLPDQGRLVSAADRLWVLTDAGKSLTGIDLRSGRPGKPIALPGTCADLATDGAVLWATCPIEDLFLRIDPDAGEVTDEVELAGASNASVADDLWVSFDDGVAQIDPDSLEVLAVYEAFSAYGGALFATPDAVWAREEQGHFLVHIDPAEQRIVETIEAPNLPSGGDVVVIGDSVWATAYDDQALVQIRAE